MHIHLLVVYAGAFKHTISKSMQLLMVFLPAQYCAGCLRQPGQTTLPCWCLRYLFDRLLAVKTENYYKALAMNLHLKNKLIIGFSAIIIMTGTITIVAGTYLIGKNVINQVQDKVKNDLNAAEEICKHRISDIKNTIYFATLQSSIKEAIVKKDIEKLKGCLEKVRKNGNMEIATITDAEGIVLLRSHNYACFGDDQSKDQIIQKVLSDKQIVAGTTIISGEELRKEGKDLVERVCLTFMSSPGITTGFKQDDASGLMFKSAAPVWSNSGKLIGILYGGDIINQNYNLVDKIKNILYQNQTYNGMDMGTATIFQRDLRIATNVITNEGKRAVGTKVSKEVFEKVILEGNKFIGRAFVFNGWYVSAYEAIKDVNGNIIGMLGLGLLEQKFVDLKQRTLMIFFAVTIIGMILVLLVSNLFANTIIKPLNYMVKISKKISAGDFSVKVKVESKDELGELEKAFNAMTSALQERDYELKKQTHQQLMRSEKLSALGRMAAGIAHEVNNPLTGILMYSNLLLKNLPKESQNSKDMEIIIHETIRCRDLLRNLLNFAREDVPNKQLVKINDIVHEIISIMGNNVYFEKITTLTELSDDLPFVMIDPNQFKQILMNFVLNAAEAMSDGGKLVLQTLFDKAEDNVVIKVTDTGSGIPEKNINKIFDPFFTTKAPGKGTGLGLAVNYGIVRRHGGQINIESRVGVGTTFIVRLPAQTGSTDQTGGVN